MLVISAVSEELIYINLTNIAAHKVQNCISSEEWSHLMILSFSSDDPLVISCTEDTLNTSHPITPLKASVSFVESSNRNGNASYCNNFFRSQSEPQEDEYCGT